ncbi:hypothetical protein EDB85DRAFT_302896 [Lactarius pseudohatsudake]|nr:hypothetical protein EDB85DRAFT_302896 [Lactarius pseudohatsudake]
MPYHEVRSAKVPYVHPRPTYSLTWPPIYSAQSLPRDPRFEDTMMFEPTLSSLAYLTAFATSRCVWASLRRERQDERALHPHAAQGRRRDCGACGDPPSTPARLLLAIFCTEFGAGVGKEPSVIAGNQFPHPQTPSGLRLPLSSSYEELSGGLDAFGRCVCSLGCIFFLTVPWSHINDAVWTDPSKRCRNGGNLSLPTHVVYWLCV